MPTPLIIGLLGPASAGKTTLANELLRIHPAARRISFAEAIRNMLEALGVTRDQMSSRKLDPIPWLGNHSPRYLMQTLGTEWGRGYISQDIWASALVRTANKEGGLVIVDDVRFDNEAKILRDAGALLLVIHCVGRGFTYSHASEDGLSDWGLVHGVVHQQLGQIFLGKSATPFLPRRPWWARKWFRWVRHFTGPRVFSNPPFAPVEQTAKIVSRVWGLHAATKKPSQ